MQCVDCNEYVFNHCLSCNNVICNGCLGDRIPYNKIYKSVVEKINPDRPVPEFVYICKKCLKLCKKNKIPK